MIPHLARASAHEGTRSREGHLRPMNTPPVNQRRRGVTSAGRLRTFTYEGEEVVFPKHLRIGTGESSREGWRCHFHHSGAHLAF